MRKVVQPKQTHRTQNTCMADHFIHFFFFYTSLKDVYMSRRVDVYTYILTQRQRRLLSCLEDCKEKVHHDRER